MNKIVAAGILSVALAGSLGFTACGSESDGSAQGPAAETSGAEAQQAAEEAAAPEEAEEPAPVSDYQVSIDGAAVSTDHEGKPVVVVTYSWTNNSDDTTSAMVALYEKCFQDGVDLSGAYFVDGLDSDGNMADVRPGAGTTYQKAYELSNTESPIEVEVTELISFNKDILASATFEVA